MNTPLPEEENDTPATPQAMGWAILIVLIAVALLLLANNKNLSKVPPEPSVVEAFHQAVPEAQALIAQGERDGLLRLEPENKRAFIAAGVWNGGDAQRKETLVNMLAMECARRRGDQSIRIDVLDKQSGKTLASLSQWDGLKIH